MAATAQNNVRYVSGALFLHALVAALMVFATLYSPHIVVPQLGIKASLVSNDNLYPPRPQPPAPDQHKLEQQQQEQQEQIAQQKQKEQQAQLLAEQEKEKQKQAEQQRIAEAQQQAKRQKQLEEQKRIDAIKQKQREIQQRQAAAAAQARREADLKAQLAEEEGRDQAISAGLQNQYAAIIRQVVERNWIKPPSAQNGIRCEVQVTQAVGGMVLSVSFGKCNGGAAVRQSIENAVMRSSPLPPPGDPRLFDRHLSFIFNPAE